MSYSEGFTQLLNHLRLRAEEAEAMGMNQGEIASITKQVGDWLAREAEPRTHEQRLLKDLWRLSDDQEAQVLSRLLVRLAAEQTPQALGGRPLER